MSIQMTPHTTASRLSGDGKRSGECGMIDDTVAIVTTADMKVEKMIDVGQIPDWATGSADGRYCFVSLSGDNAIAVIELRSRARREDGGQSGGPRNALDSAVAQIAVLYPSPG